MQMYSDSCLTIANVILEKGNKVLCRKEHNTRRDKIQKNRGEMRHSENEIYNVFLFVYFDRGRRRWK